MDSNSRENTGDSFSLLEQFNKNRPLEAYREKVTSQERTTNYFGTDDDVDSVEYSERITSYLNDSLTEPEVLTNKRETDDFIPLASSDDDIDSDEYSERVSRYLNDSTKSEVVINVERNCSSKHSTDNFDTDDDIVSDEYSEQITSSLNDSLTKPEVSTNIERNTTCKRETDDFISLASSDDDMDSDEYSERISRYLNDSVKPEVVIKVERNSSSAISSISSVRMSSEEDCSESLNGSICDTEELPIQNGLNDLHNQTLSTDTKTNFARNEKVSFYVSDSDSDIDSSDYEKRVSQHLSQFSFVKKEMISSISSIETSSEEDCNERWDSSICDAEELPVQNGLDNLHNQTLTTDTKTNIAGNEKVTFYVSDSDSNIDNSDYEKRVSRYLSQFSFVNKGSSDGDSSSSCSSGDSSGSFFPTVGSRQRTLYKRRMWRNLEQSLKEEKYEQEREIARKRMAVCREKCQNGSRADREKKKRTRPRENKQTVSKKRLRFNAYINAGRGRNRFLKDLQIAQLLKKNGESEFSNGFGDEANCDTTDAYRLTDLLCELCRTSFNSLSLLDSHMVDKHEGFINHVCLQCGQVYFEKDEFTSHVDLCRKNENASCYICNEILDGCLSTLEEHFKIAHSTLDLYRSTCGNCSLRFVSEEVLKRHRNNTLENNCCPTSLIQTFKPHIRQQINKKFVKAIFQNCEQCDKMFFTSTGYKRHRLMKHENKTDHACDLCEKSYVFRYKLIEHRKASHSAEKHPCKKCGKCFNTKYSLSSHDKSHVETGDMFECDYCGMKFLRKQLLVDHLDTKFTTCPWCRKVYGCRATLNDHIKFHTVENKLPCIKCKKYVSNMTNFWKHLNIVHPELYVVLNTDFVLCDGCFKVCSTKHQLRKHKRNKCVRMDELVCRHCRIKFETKAYVERHLREDKLVCVLCDLRFKCMTFLLEHTVKNHSLVRDDTSVKSEPIVDADLCDDSYEADNSRNVDISVERNPLSADEIIMNFEQNFKVEYISDYSNYGINDTHVKVENSTVDSSYNHTVSKFPFECNYCKTKYETAGGLRNHKILAHLKKTLIECVFCSRSFNCKADLTCHFRVNKCPICQVGISCETFLVNHLNDVHKKVDNLLTCKICEMRFDPVGDFIDHTLSCSEFKEKLTSCSFDGNNVSDKENNRLRSDPLENDKGELKIIPKTQLLGKRKYPFFENIPSNLKPRVVIELLPSLKSGGCEPNKVINVKNNATNLPHVQINKKCLENSDSLKVLPKDIKIEDTNRVKALGLNLINGSARCEPSGTSNTLISSVEEKGDESVKSPNSKFLSDRREPSGFSDRSISYSEGIKDVNSIEPASTALENKIPNNKIEISELLDVSISSCKDREIYFGSPNSDLAKNKFNASEMLDVRDVKMEMPFESPGASQSEFDRLSKTSELSVPSNPEYEVYFEELNDVVGVEKKQTSIAISDKSISFCNKENEGYLQILNCENSIKDKHTSIEPDSNKLPDLSFSSCEEEQDG